MRNVSVSKLSLVLLIALAALPAAAYAQSAIAGAVTDTTGGVLPGVTIEASSPALIEQSRTVVTGGQGRYRVIDLRPGTYTVTFTLPGFNTVIREGIVLEADFTATVDVQMRVGALEETITVSGASPVVDVQSTQRRDVLTRDVIDAIPTGRNYQTIGRTLPAVSMTGGSSRFDVAGSTAMWQGQLAAYGGRGQDQSTEVDGMTISAVLQSGQHPAVYLNDGAFQEYVFQVSSGVAETQTGGVRINMIPREGGNQFSGQFITLFSNTDLQGQNVTDKLRARGLTTPAALYRLYDVNGSLGGPIVRNRLWFFTSTRVWAYNNFVANAFNPDGSQAQDDNLLEGYTNRLTWQMSQKNKLTAVLDRLPKYRGHRNLEVGGVDPKATVVQSTPLSYYAQAKWTSTLTNKLLLEAGYSTNFYGFKLSYRPEVKGPSASDPFGDIAKRDIILGTLRNAAESSLNWPMYKYHISSAVSYVTGSHALKTGVQWTWGHERQLFTVNGDLVQRYANGVPHSVLIRNTPTFQRQDLKADLGLYVQDTWTIDRLTLNPGLRFEYFNGEVPEQTAPAGRFVPARRFDRIPNLPNWKNVAPRFGAAYDLFGNGKTAVKGSIGKYLQQESVGYPNTYNPMVLSSDIRPWRDLNADDIAQENELGSTTNLAFGIRRNRNPDPEIERPYQLLYNLGIQHELLTGLGVSVSYYRRGFYNIHWTDNLDTTHADYTLVTIPDPRGNGQTLPVYNLNSNKLGFVNDLDTHSTENAETFNGVDVTFNARFPNGAAVFGGTSTGRTRRVICQVDDPNELRFCDDTKYDIPFLTTFKLSGSYPLPSGFRLSGVFQSVPGEELSGRATGRIHYVVDRRIIPTLTLAQVLVPLNEPGSEYYDRVNQLDIGVSRIFRLGRVQVNPQLDLFNALNVSPLLLQVNSFGPALRQARRILDARVLRLGVQVNF